MRIILSNDSPVNTILTNEYGQVLYKINTLSPNVLHPGKITTISRVIPNDLPDGDAEVIDMQDRYETIAEIEWKKVTSSKLRFHGKEVELKNWMPRENLLGRQRTFVGTDGQSYRWNLPVLERKTGSITVTPIAKHHRNLLTKQKPVLEVFPAGEDILDSIVVTWAYVEKWRRNK